MLFYNDTAVPSIPDSKMKKQSHHTGLKLNIKL